MRKIYSVIVLVALLNYYPSHSQSTATIALPAATEVNRAAFFAEEKPIEMTLATDFKKITSERKKGVYQPGSATFYFSPTDTITENIRLYARGEFRRKECAMPGLMINFKNETSPRLSSLKKIKLVCGCSTNTYGEQLILMEYLIYKMYNLVTDMSFKVRLVKINYKDTKERLKPYTQYAFMIEDIDDMAKRNQCKEIEKISFTTEQTNRPQMTVVALFQYMIGNTDWAVPNYHNIKLMRSLSDSLSVPYVVPYDFDFAGLVNARYATPAPELGIEKVTERVYRGFSRTMVELDLALEIFRKQKDNMLSLIKNFELVNKRDRDLMYDYVKEFYDILERKRDVQNIFIYGARKE
jgi:hypothetical protein